MPETNHREDALAKRIRELADAAPPLSPERRARLAALLQPASATKPLSKEQLAAQKREREADQRARAIKAAVAAAPPLSPENLRAVVALMQDPDETREQIKQERARLPKLPPVAEQLWSAPPPTMPKPRVPIMEGVYFLRGGDFIKIGVSADVNKRIASINTMSPVPLTVVAVVSGNRNDETALHRRFAHLRSHGEWFRAEPELLDFIASIGWKPEEV